MVESGPEVGETCVRASGPMLLSRSSSRSYVSFEFGGTTAYGAPTALAPKPCIIISA